MNDDAGRIQELAADDAAQALIYRKSYPDVFQVAYRVLENYEDAEEIADDAFVKAFNNLQQLTDTAKLPAWIKTIARNLAVDKLRAAKHRGTHVPFDDTQARYIGDAVDYRSTEQCALRRTRMTLQNRLLRLMQPKDRLVMELHYLEGKTYKAIAEVTGATERAVGNRVRRARQFLKTVANRFDDWFLSLNEAAAEDAAKAIDLLAVIPVDEVHMVEHYLLDQCSLAETAQSMHVSPRDVVMGLKHAMKQWKNFLQGQEV